jgi:predicted MFS family arabinose efflux permease
VFLRATFGSSTRTKIGPHPQTAALPRENVLKRRESLKRLAVSWMTLFVIGADLFVSSPLLPYIAREFVISVTFAGLSITLFSICYMASAPLFGHWADKVGHRRLLIPCLISFAVANSVTAHAVSMTWFLVARSAAGISAAGISPSIYALVSTQAPARRRATHLAITVSGLMVSLMVAAPAAAIAAAHFGWSSVFVGLSAAAWLLALVNLRVWSGEHGHVGPAPDVRLRISSLICRLIPMVMWSTSLYSMFTYLGTSLMSLRYSVHRAAMVMLFYGIGSIAGSLLGGRFADRLGVRFTSTAGLVGLGGCLLLAQLALRGPLLVAGCSFLMLSAVAQLFFPAQQAGLAIDFAARRAAVLAWNNSALFLGISLGAVIGGQAVALGGVDAELAIAALLAVIGGAINLLVVAEPGPVSRPGPAEA